MIPVTSPGPGSAEPVADPSGSRHSIILFTDRRMPLLAGELLGLAEQALKALPARYPGLRILKSSFQPDRVEWQMDLGRLDEDVQRIVQSFKSEVRNLARRRNLRSGNLWQWGHKEE